MDQLLSPQFGDLMLDDEEHLIVMRRRRQGALLRQQFRQAQISGVVHAACKIGHNPRFERSLVVLHKGPLYDCPVNWATSSSMRICVPQVSEIEHENGMM